MTENSIVLTKGTLIRSFNTTNRLFNSPQRYQLLHLDYGAENEGVEFGDPTDYTYRPPKQKDKSKPKPNVDQEYSEKTGTPENNSPYSAYQYEFPYQYPYNFFNTAPSTSSSGTNSKTKTKKKPSGSAQNVKKPAKDSDKTVVPFISISVAASHQAKNDDSENSNDSNADANSKSVYQPDKKPPPDQAAYFNYLNTYNPTNNQDLVQHAQTAGGGLNPAHYGYGVPLNAANSYGYGYSPFNGYNPMLVPYYNVATTPSPHERSGQNLKSLESSRSINQKTRNSRDNHASSKKNARKP